MFAIRILLLLAIGLLIFSCTRRKKAPGNISEWLEVHFPGRFDVVDTRTSDPIKNLSFKVKKSVIAEKSDSLLQIELTWDAREPNLGLSVEKIESLLQEAKPALADTRELLSLVKATDLSGASVSVDRGDACVLVFEEPTPEQRKKVLNTLKSVYESWEAAGQNRLWLIFMEPSVKGIEFAEIVPLVHRVRPDSWQIRHTLVDLIIEPGTDFNVTKLNQQWRFNTNSDRLLAWLDKARPIAEQWASEHLKKKVYFNTQSEYTALEKQLGAELRFPFSYQENDSIAGYIQGNYLLDANRFENLEVSKRTAEPRSAN